jgi:hypothetical protein
MKESMDEFFQKDTDKSTKFRGVSLSEKNEKNGNENRSEYDSSVKSLGNSFDDGYISSPSQSGNIYIYICI